jgi:hypothetical protein
MLPVLFVLLLQSTTISGNLSAPAGMASPDSARVVLLPAEYALMFNAEAQRRIDRFWDNYKPDFAANKQLFFKVPPIAFDEALEIVVLRMRGDPKINVSNMIRTATGGRFEFHGVPPGEYKIVALATIKDTEYAWTESFQVAKTPLVLQMKNRVP